MNKGAMTDNPKLKEAILRYQGHDITAKGYGVNTFHVTAYSLATLVLSGRFAVEDLELIAIAATEVAKDHLLHREKVKCES